MWLQSMLQKSLTSLRCLTRISKEASWGLKVILSHFSVEISSLFPPPAPPVIPFFFFISLILPLLPSLQRSWHTISLQMTLLLCLIVPPSSANRSHDQVFIVYAFLEFVREVSTCKSRNRLCSLRLWDAGRCTWDNKWDFFSHRYKHWMINCEQSVIYWWRS